MAITIKEIHEKEFSRQVRGYSIDEVDDFLDEIAAQMESLIRENRALNQQLSSRPAVVEPPVPVVAAPVPVVPAPLPAPVAAPPEPVAVEKTAAPNAGGSERLPPLVDEPAYFKNLETTLRETLISAQRIADDTVSEARKKANQLVSGAEEKANQMVSHAEEQSNAILATAKVEAESVRAENAEIRKAAEDYRARFLRLVEDQMHVLKADGSMFE